MKYDVYTLETWGNLQSGYWTNDMVSEGEVDLPNLANDTIFRKLREMKIVYGRVEYYRFDFHRGRIAVTRASDGYPVCDLFEVHPLPITQGTFTIKRRSHHNLCE